MNDSNSMQKIKFDKTPCIGALILMLTLYVPISKMIQQGMHFHEYLQFVFAFIICVLVYWNFIRVGILSLFGVPAIVLNDDTVTFAINGYTISWKDITYMNLEVYHSRSTSYTLIIKVKDPWFYISQTKNPLLRNYRWFTRDIYNPFCVALTNVDGNPNEVYSLLETYYHRRR
jgi:hypothetical protein